MVPHKNSGGNDTWDDFHKLIEIIGEAPGRKTWDLLSQKIAQVAGRDSPYSTAYMIALYNGSMKPSPRIREAVDRLIRTFTFASGIVGPQPKVCSDPDCSNLFVPNVGTRTKCYICSPIKQDGIEFYERKGNNVAP